MEILTNSPQETQELGQKIANKLNSNLVCLYGELGTGKTTFVQGFAKGFGIKDRILSPTFIMIRIYKIPPENQKSHSNFYHVDLYRAKNEKDAKTIGLSELWQDPKNLVIIEWADRIKKILPKNRTDIYFKYLSKNKRKIKITNLTIC